MDQKDDGDSKMKKGNALVIVFGMMMMMMVWVLLRRRQDRKSSSTTCTISTTMTTIDARFSLERRWWSYNNNFDGSRCSLQLVQGLLLLLLLLLPLLVLLLLIHDDGFHNQMSHGNLHSLPIFLVISVATDSRDLEWKPIPRKVCLQRLVWGNNWAVICERLITYE